MGRIVIGPNVRRPENDELECTHCDARLEYVPDNKPKIWGETTKTIWLDCPSCGGRVYVRCV